MKQEFSERLMEVFEGQLRLWGLDFGQGRRESLAAYAEELAEYDRANVIGTRELDRIWLDHVLDSLSCLLCEPLRKAGSLVDVGSGGGMPGLPLHLAVGFPRICLLESTGKKAEFLRHVAFRLASEEVEIVNHRAEEIGQRPGYRTSFEAATVRAVAPLAVISEYCLPLLSPQGVMVAMKGGVDSREYREGVKAASMLGGELEETIQVPFAPGMESKERNLVVIRKVRPTPERYPRNVGVPRKSPLGSGG